MESLANSKIFFHKSTLYSQRKHPIIYQPSQQYLISINFVSEIEATTTFFECLIVTILAPLTKTQVAKNSQRSEHAARKGREKKGQRRMIDGSRRRRPRRIRLFETRSTIEFSHPSFCVKTTIEPTAFVGRKKNNRQKGNLYVNQFTLPN